VHAVWTDALLQRFLRRAYQVLKPGEILGIVAHRATPDMPAARSYKLRRLPQTYLVHETQQAGFRIAGTSEVNANPKDLDHPGMISSAFTYPRAERSREIGGHR
jgi:predicted methyltransferase